MPSRIRLFRRLELRNFREVEVLYLHCWDNHIRGFFSAGANGLTHVRDVLEHMDQALVETEVANAAPHFALFNLEGAIAGHASDDLVVRVHLADVPQTGYKNAAVGGGDHLFQGLRLGFNRMSKHYIERGLPKFIRQGKPMARRSHAADLASHFRVEHAFRSRA